MKTLNRGRRREKEKKNAINNITKNRIKMI